MLLSLGLCLQITVHFAGERMREAAHNGAILEGVARMACFTVRINEGAEAVGRSLHDEHYLREHGSNAYYGQHKEGK
ncbi:MAG: hypothetical protein WA628_15010 [Terriglobales bacterium]